MPCAKKTKKGNITKIYSSGNKNNNTYCSAEREQRRYYLRDIFLLPQIHCLENVNVIHPVVL